MWMASHEIMFCPPSKTCVKHVLVPLLFCSAYSSFIQERQDTKYSDTHDVV